MLLAHPNTLVFLIVGIHIINKQTQKPLDHIFESLFHISQYMAISISLTLARVQS